MTVSTIGSNFPPATAPVETQEKSITAVALLCITEGASAVSYCLSVVSYPFNYTACLLRKNMCTRALLLPFDWIIDTIIYLFDAICYRLQNYFSPGPLEFSSEQTDTYWALGSDKWKEGVESDYHKHGSQVFDQGLHAGTVEPGYNRSWRRAAHFLSHQFSRKVNSQLFLNVHKLACGHFVGGVGGTLMGQEKVGVFRGNEDIVKINFGKNTYLLREGLKEEFAALNASMQERFGTTLGRFEINEDNLGHTLHYTKMSQEQVQTIYDYFSNELQAELAPSKTRREKFWAICRFYRHTEWLHAARDGSTRTNGLLLNFLLTQNGFSPALLPAVCLCNVVKEAHWVYYVEHGMARWKAAVNEKPEPTDITPTLGGRCIA